MSEIAENIQRIQQAIREAAERVNRNPAGVTLIGVTKTLSAEVVNEALAAGLTHVGENRVQEAKAKFPLLAKPVTRHLIGHLQRNKVKDAVLLFDMIHSVDSLELAREINKRAADAGRVMDILLQVNVSGEETKFGMEEDKLPGTLQEIAGLSNIRARGLMTIAPLTDNPERVRPYFARLRELLETMKNRGFVGNGFDQLSMGMTGDFRVAVEEGATLVRIGTGIFGPRVYHHG